MKKIVSLFFCLCVVMSASLAQAGVDVSINIGVPPPLLFEEPPEMVVVPGAGAYVYMVPDMLGVYFYGGFWYRLHDGHWFRARSYDGPWGYIVRSRVPRYVLGVPPDYYLHLPPGYHRVPYGDLHSHWRDWDRGRHWNRYDWYKHEFREHERRRHSGEYKPHVQHDGGPRHDDRRRDGQRYDTHSGGGPKHDSQKYGSGGPKHDSGPKVQRQDPRQQQQHKSGQAVDRGDRRAGGGGEKLGGSGQKPGMGQKPGGGQKGGQSHQDKQEGLERGR